MLLFLEAVTFARIIFSLQILFFHRNLRNLRSVARTLQNRASLFAFWSASLSIIIIISIFWEDNVFRKYASLPYRPPVNTDIDYYQTFLGLIV